MKLRKSDIESFQYEGKDKGRDVRWDSAVSGLGIRIYPTDRKAFVLSYRTEDGKKRMLTLGDYGPLTLGKAREIATQRKAEVIAGRDPVKERKAKRELSSNPDLYQTVVEGFIEKYAKPRQRTWQQTEHALKVNCAEWLKRPIADIGKSDAYGLIEGIQATGREATARNTLVWLKTLFKWAVKRDYLEASVMEAVEIEFHKTVRERYFDDDEVEALWNGCNQLTPIEGAYLKVLILLGVRKGELAGMRWNEFREDGAIWVVPHERTKTRKTQQKKREYTVPLPPLAQRILKGMPRTEGDDLVFPGRINGSALYPGTALKKKFVKEAGVEGFTYHACRHTISTWLENGGYSEYERGLILNHISTTVTAGYGHGYPVELKRQLLEKWADHVAGLVQPDGVVLLS